MKKSVLGRLNIKLAQKDFNSLNEMREYLDSQYNEVDLVEIQRIRKKSVVNKPVMKELISDIKKHECIIF